MTVPPDKAPREPTLPNGDFCPRCGEPYDRGQEYCLECGLRLPTETGVVGTLSTAWRRRVPWYPGDWVWPVLLGLLVAAIAALVAILLTHNSSSTSTLVVTGPPTGTVPTTTTTPTTTRTRTTTPTTTTSPPTTTAPPPPPPPPQNAVIAWPNKDGFTVVLNSVPTSGGRTAANAEAKKALDAGLKPVGVLESSKYSSLTPGYYVVFLGVYSSQAAAEDGSVRAHGNGYPTAYVRPVVRPVAH